MKGATISALLLLALCLPLLLFSAGNTLNHGLGKRKDYAVGLKPSGIASADFNRDGLPDLVTANYGGQSVSVLLITKTESQTSPPEITTTTA